MGLVVNTERLDRHLLRNVNFEVVVEHKAIEHFKKGTNGAPFLVTN